LLIAGIGNATVLQVKVTDVVDINLAILSATIPPIGRKRIAVDSTCCTTSRRMSRWSSSLMGRLAMG
jgi:hypothetical protein